MVSDRTQHQSLEEQQHAQELSQRPRRPPTDVPGYDVQSLLGTGAYGEVWTALDQNTGRRVAIKFYTHRGGVDWTLLSREVKNLVSLSADRYIVEVLAVGWDAEPPYYVMEYLENGSLDDLLRQQGPLPANEAVEFFQEIAVGLLHSHGKGVLHCDLKPANILLDQDHRPRLADFGQSRLSHEQKPALGTLFYMAPEQADMEAAPDARWDVYALGAIVYCLLTGSPPHRDKESVEHIETSSSLAERLKRYRETLANSPPPQGHLRVPGVDRALGEIISQCLAPDPNRRYANVQEVIDALEIRQKVRTRKPLMVLGIVGPLMVLLVMGMFGWRGYGHAKDQSTDALRRRAFESNAFAAKFVARTLEAEIERYFQIVEQESRRNDFLTEFRVLLDHPDLETLADPGLPAAEAAPVREAFLGDPRRVPMRSYLRERLDLYLARAEQDVRAPKFGSMFVLDPRGTILAVVYDDEQIQTRSLGRNFSWRTYFHGGPVDLPRHLRTPEIQPIRRPHLSAVFQSTTSGLWKVAVSTPIYGSPDGNSEFLGVLVFTVNLGDFAALRNEQKGDDDRFAVLVDGRRGESQGTILQHPLFKNQVDDPEHLLVDYNQPEYRLTEQQLQQLATNWRFRYIDPLSRAPLGTPYRGSWIAALEPVDLRTRDDTEPARAADLLVVVQELEQAATAPVRQLGTRLVQEGLFALTSSLLVVMLMWYVVLGVWGMPTGRRAGRYGGRTESQPMHETPTLSATGGMRSAHTQPQSPKEAP